MTPAYKVKYALNNLLVGQEAFKEAVIKTLRRYSVGLHDKKRPVCSYILAGPTGVGKSHAVFSLAKAIHGTDFRDPVLVIDCEALQEDHEVARLVGAPPGYVGHRDTVPMLSSGRVAAYKSYNSNLAVILFDEIEKASPALQRILLSVLDRGELQTGDGDTVRFNNTMIFFTSNLGAQEYSRRHIGFSSSPSKSCFIRAIEKHFSPEFRGRLSGVIEFLPLSREELLKIAKMEVIALNNRLFESKPRVKIVVELSYLERIIAESDCDKYNARGIRKAVERMVADPVAEYIDCADELDGGKHEVVEGNIYLEVRPHAKTASK